MAYYTVEFYAKALARKTKVDLVIPSLNLQKSLGNKDENYYCNSQEKFPLLICLHGFGENEKSWALNSSIAKLCEDKGIAACFINGENKWYLNMGPIDDFYALIERDLFDFLYGNFRFLDKNMPRVIIGASMGGYGALYHYLKNTDKYLGCVALSPATKPDFIDESKYGTLRELFVSTKNKNLNVYLSVGTKDFIIGASKELDEFLGENGVKTRYRFVENCDHSWNTWNLQMNEVFDYLHEIGIKK